MQVCDVPLQYLQKPSWISHSSQPGVSGRGLCASDIDSIINIVALRYWTSRHISHPLSTEHRSANPQ